MEHGLTRKVYFFRLANYLEFHPILEDSVAYIDNLPFDDQGRYLTTVSDDIVHALFVTSTNYPIKLQFGRIRRSGLPLVEDGGDISPLEIARSAGILDWSHIVIFDDGTVAAEFNRDAPRLARLGEYLAFKSRGILPSAPRFNPLYQREILDELENFQTVTILEVEALTTDADIIGEAEPSLGMAFKACRLSGSVNKAKLVLKSVHSADGSLKGIARRLMLNAGSREALTALKARGRTPEGRKPLDMLEEYLVSTEEFMKLDRSRAISTDHAFSTIERAYEKNKSRLTLAATANAPW